MTKKQRKHRKRLSRHRMKYNRCRCAVDKCGRCKAPYNSEFCRTMENFRNIIERAKNLDLSLYYKQNNAKEGNMPTDFEVKVTKIGDSWYARLIHVASDRVWDQMSCDDRRNIGWICREMMRWVSKCGSFSAYVESSRERHNKDSVEVPKGVRYE